MLTTEQKDFIVAGAKEYCINNSLSQRLFSHYSKVSETYVSRMWNGCYTQKSGKRKDGEETVIPDMYFYNIAEKARISVVDVSWHTVETRQYMKTLVAMLQAREHCRTRTIIGEPGHGKTYTANLVKAQAPGSVVKISVTIAHNLPDILDDIADELDIPRRKNKVASLRDIAAKIKDKSAKGHKPLIIIDEIENLRIPQIGALKAIYDSIGDYCGIAFVGTPDFITNMDKWLLKGKCGAKQFYSRIFAGITELDVISTADFDGFFEGLPDESLKATLRKQCPDYRALNDFLEPAMREASRDGIMLTDEYFRTMYKIK